VALDVASALAFLHARKTMHFDVKAGNVMLTRDFAAKLGDVGLSKAMTHTFASKQGGVGTFAWCAPEVLQGKPCTYSADVFSYGVLLFEIVTGEVPLRGRLVMPRVPEQCPQAVVDLMLRCMQEDPAQRPTANQLVEELAALTGQKLAGNNGLLSGEDGLDRTTASPAGGSANTEEAPGAASPVHATRLAGVEAERLPALPPSPFA
jgi:serine/threonine protein kinase